MAINAWPLVILTTFRFLIEFCDFYVPPYTRKSSKKKHAKRNNYDLPNLHEPSWFSQLFSLKNTTTVDVRFLIDASSTKAFACVMKNADIRGLICVFGPRHAPNLLRKIWAFKKSDKIFRENCSNSWNVFFNYFQNFSKQIIHCKNVHILMQKT